MEKQKEVVQDTVQKGALLQSLGKTSDRLVDLLNKFEPEQINRPPFEGSWTAAQVADHITLSNISIAKALALKGTEINRRPDERVKELQDIFLDFSSKLQAPDFILPAQDIYEMTALLIRLEESIKKIAALGEEKDLSEMISHPAFGDITKFEILHFVLYHTQRHTHQLENIYRLVSGRNNKSV